MSASSLERPDLYRVDLAGTMEVDLHPGQYRAWRSRRRFVLITAGTQSGKTSFGPLWLEREILEKGPGDYLIVTPDFPLLEVKLLPELRRLFEELKGYGRYYASPRRRFVFTPEGDRRMWGTPQEVRTTIHFGYAEDPNSLESATIKAAWLDEAGQKKFKLSSWYAILRRLSLSQGRVLMTTTPYNLGWLYQKIYLPWKNGNPLVQVVNFESLMNPAFPRAEWDRAKEDMPRWMFNMMYRGLFERPAGLIYDSFNREQHTCKRFAIPDHWPRYLGLDFGAINTVGVFYAQEPGTGRLFLYRTYRAGKRTASSHVAALLLGEKGIPKAYGGARAEHNWRAEFRAAGLPVEGPDQPDIEIGITRVYGAHARGEIVVFDDEEEYLDQKTTYARPVDDVGNILPGIEDQHAYHYMDAERYIISPLRSTRSAMLSMSRSGGLRRGGFDDGAEGRFADPFGYS